MNIYEKLGVLAQILGVDEEGLDPEIILDGMPQWNTSSQKKLTELIKKQSGFKLSAQRIDTLTTVQDVLDLMG